MCIVIMCSKIDICSADAVKRNWDLNYCTYQTVVIAYCYRMISTKAIITPVCVLGRGSDGMLLAHSLTEFERDTSTSGEFNLLTRIIFLMFILYSIFFIVCHILHQKWFKVAENVLQ